MYYACVCAHTYTYTYTYTIDNGVFNYNYSFVLNVRGERGEFLMSVMDMFFGMVGRRGSEK